MDEEIYNKGLEELSKEITSYEQDVLNSFNKFAPLKNNKFLTSLNKRTEEAKKNCMNIFSSTLKSLFLASSIPLFKDVISIFIKSAKAYIYSCFSQYKGVYTSLFSKYREQYSEAFIRDSLLKDVLKARNRARDFVLGKEDIVISVGKRSFKLSNYVRIVFEQEVREKFNLGYFKQAKKSGAIGIRISDHNTKTKLCDIYEGKTYYFANNGISKLKHGLPPFHINCKHFIIPVYAHE